MRFATKAIRVGQDPDATHHAVVPPIWQTSTFAWTSLDEVPKIDYTRCTNPGRISLEQALASLESANHCTVFGSGMAAIAATLSVLESGDHFLMATDIYGGTFRMADVYLRKMGVSYSSFDANRPASIAEAVRPNTKLLIFETPSNPNLRVCDIAAVAAEAKKHGLTVIFDNTFASPVLQNPLELGVDLVVHSTTKYISGHSDVIGGAVLTNDDDLAFAVYEWSKAYGPVPSPFDCWLSLRGVKTMKVRVAEHCRNAQAVAEFLETQPGVTRVHYPGLPSHPDHAVASRQMKGGYGGMVALELETAALARAVAERTQVFLLAESLGGVESLVAYPPLMSHATMTEDQRVERGIPPTMLRLSVGIEDVEDLTEDLGQAIASARAHLLAAV